MPRTKNPFKALLKKRKTPPTSSSSSTSRSSSAHASDPSFGVDAAADEVYSANSSESGGEEPEMAPGHEPVGPIFFRSVDHGKAMTYFSNKKYENTKTVDRGTLVTLGVHNQFLAFTTNLGIEPRFWDIKEKSYTRLTAEFLSTFGLTRSGELLAFTCQLQETPMEITELEIAKWFGFTPGGQEEVDYPVNIYKEISDTEPPANKDSPRAKFIHHPVLRVIQRALAQTVFARGESAIQVRLEELGLLGRVMYPSLPRANIAAWMINYWATIAANRRAGKGQIQIGQFITYIAKKKKLNLSGMEETKGYSTMDLTFFQNAGFIQKAAGRWLWKLPGYNLYYLPINKEVVPRDMSSALLKGYDGPFYGMEEEEVRPPSPPVRPAAHVGGTSSTRASTEQGAFDFNALYERLGNLERLSTESLELGRKIDERIEKVEEEQQATRRDLDLLMQYHEDDGATRNQVAEVYNWWYPQYGQYMPPPPPPQN